MEDNLEVYFCDLCNESVPQRDLEKGAAVRIRGKVIGSCCLDEMRGGKTATPAGRGGVMAAAIVLLAAVAAATVFLDWRISEETAALGKEVAQIEGKTREQDERFRAIEKRLESMGSRADLERIERRVGEVRSWMDATESRLRESVSATTEQVRRLGRDLEGMAEIGSRQSDGLEDLAKRIGILGEEIAALKAMPRPAARPEAADAVPPMVAGGTDEPDVAAGGLPRDLAHHVSKLDDPDPGTRFEAVDKLVQSKNPAVREPLIEALRDSDPFVRRLTAEGLRSFKHAATVEALLTALADPEGIVRHAAYSSLKALTGQSIDFDPDGSREARASAQRRWKEWWRRNKDGF